MGKQVAAPAMFSGLAAMGGAVVEAWLSLLLLLNISGPVCAATFRALRRPSTFRLTSTVHHVDQVAWQAIPIILLITFLIGGIIAQQGFFHFRKFGAEDYVVDMVGILVLREIGVLIVAIMVAGRSGSSYTAELGSMKMREEIDALRTMGFNPVDVLILPRVVALVIGLPILTFIGSISALYGGELVAWLYGGMSPDIFVARLKEAISITHFKVGLIKAPFMALIIGVVACAEGLKVAGSARYSRSSDNIIRRDVHFFSYRSRWPICCLFRFNRNVAACKVSIPNPSLAFETWSSVSIVAPCSIAFLWTFSLAKFSGSLEAPGVGNRSCSAPS